MDFAEAFDRDLHARGFEQSQVCVMLSEGESSILTSAAISNWKKRDVVPQARLEKLVAIFGPDSNLAQYAKQPDRVRLETRGNRWRYTTLLPKLDAAELVYRQTVEDGAPPNRGWRTDIVACAPESWLGYFNQMQATGLGLTRYSFSSPKLLAEFCHASLAHPAVPLEAHRCLFKLLVRRQLDMPNLRQYALIVYDPNSTFKGSPNYDRLAVQAAILGVSVECASTPNHIHDLLDHLSRAPQPQGPEEEPGEED